MGSSTTVCLSSPSKHGVTKEINHLAASPHKKMLSQGSPGPASSGPWAGSCGGAPEQPRAVQCDTNRGVGDSVKTQTVGDTALVMIVLPGISCMGNYYSHNSIIHSCDRWFHLYFSLTHKTPY